MLNRILELARKKELVTKSHCHQEREEPSSSHDHAERSGNGGTKYSKNTLCPKATNQ